MLQLSRDHKVVTFRDLEERDAIAHSADEDMDFERGPVQMYGLSRVTVKDLTRPGTKGKNKVQREDYSVAGPQIYGRHNIPWVQRGRRNEDLGAIPGDILSKNYASLWDESEDPGPAADASEEAMDDSDAVLSESDLSEILVACERTSRLQHVLKSSGEPFQPLLDKLAFDLENPHRALQAPWMLRGLAAGLSRLPSDIVEQCRTRVSTCIVRLTKRTSDVVLLLRLLRLALELELDAQLDTAFVVTTKALARHLSRARTSFDTASSLIVGRLVAALSLQLQQHRLVKANSYSTTVRDLIEVLSFVTAPTDVAPVPELGHPFHRRLCCEVDVSFLTPFTIKLQRLAETAKSMMEEAQTQATYASFYSGRAAAHDSADHRARDQDHKVLHLNVHREHILADTTDAMLLGNEEDWKWNLPLRISFKGEEGIDSLLGGLGREWFRLLSKALIVEAGVLEDCATLGSSADEFCDAETGVHTVSRSTASEHVHVLGLLIGLALFYQLPLGFQPSDHTMRIAMGAGQVTQHSSLDDLAQTQPTLATNLRRLKDYNPDVIDKSEAEKEFEKTFALNWTASIIREDGCQSTVALVSGGHHKSVTLAERDSYVEALVNFHLNLIVRDQLNELQAGFRRVWGENLLDLSPREAALLIRGDADDPLSAQRLQRCVEVVNCRTSQEGAREDQSLLSTFWRSVASINENDERNTKMHTNITRRLLAFVTSSPHLPLRLHFDSAHDSTVFRIHLVDIDYMPAASTALDPWALPLPWTSTCTATLFLPRAYIAVPEDLRVSVLQAKLLKAVELGESGFGLK